MTRYPFIPPRAPKRPPPVRPVTVLEDIGGDGYSYRVALAGRSLQMFSQASKDAGNLKPGELALARRVEGSKELFLPPPRQAQQLWFSPGHIDIGGGDWRGQLWKVVSPTAAPQFVLQTGANGEEFTHLFWSQIDNELYACTHNWNTTASYVYRINQKTGTMALVASAANSDTIVSASEFGTLIYLQAGGYEGEELGYIFDPVAGTLVLGVDFQAVFGDWEWGSACAYDPIEGRIVGVPGDVARWSADGLAWNLDIDINANFQTWGIFDGMANRYDDDDLYWTGREPNAPTWSVLLKRTAAGAWVTEMAQPTWGTGCASLTCEQPGPATPGAMYVSRWAWNAAEPPQIYRKPVGGAWALDWNGPGTDWRSPGHSGIIWFWGRLMVLNLTNVGAYTDTCRLSRRDSAGSYTTIQEWTPYYPVATNCETLAMCVSGNILRKCHEV